MKALSRRIATNGMWAYALLVGCQDLNLTGDETVGGAAGASGTVSVGGTVATGGATNVAGATSTGGATSSGITTDTSSMVGGHFGYGGSSFTSSASGSTTASGGFASSGGALHSGGGPAASGGVPATGGLHGTSLASGGTPGDGGNPGFGGSSTVSPPTGGAPNSGGNPGLGGSSTVSPPTGGVSPVGGTTAAGGSPNSGGAPITGGAPATGGAPTGGTPNSELPTGGSSSTGGNPATGGLAATGGITTTGGSSGSGGTASGDGGMPGSGGTTFDQRQAALRWQPCAQITTFAQSPQNLQNMLVGCSNGDVYRTNDGLNTAPMPHWVRVDYWTTVGNQQLYLPDAPVNAIAYSPTDASTAYIAFAGSKQGRKLWKSTMNGLPWFEVTSCPLSEVWGISVNPLDSQKVYIYGPDGTMMSPDGGETWTAEVTAEPMQVPIASDAILNTVSVVPGQPDIIFVGTTNGDIFFTENATSGQNWYLTKQDAAGRRVARVTFDLSRSPVGPFATYASMGTESLWASSVAHLGWGLLQGDGLPLKAVPDPRSALYGFSINPIDDTIFYIGGTYGVGMSTNMGTTWTWTAL